MKARTRKAGVLQVLLGLVLGFSASPARTADQNKRRESLDPAIRQIAARHGVDANLVHAVILAESAYNRWAVSSAGAQGLMQLMPKTAQHYGVDDVFDPEQNIDAGVRYLRDLQSLYRDESDRTARLKKMLAAYNAGQEALKKYGGIPPYPETRAYVSRVLREYETSGARRRTVIVDFMDAEGHHIVTNITMIAAGRPR
jgi:soluble lytic murein transglycosylase-like protein